ncbi:bifunctional indole-3-glycerol phosphate synthase/phosphoribosylanthranilate isomerase [Candidatus Woesearchaeota archaeon]|nr:bifunctional indole-3-glycerol phosphate synthase/phosphoribosylanthranilate isomerase [Candidatus Woesearchaeota archaeon]
MFLQQIIRQKENEVAGFKGRTFPRRTAPLRRLSNCLRGMHNIIAEIKKQSPSAGILQEHIDIASIISSYEPYASAISVVTDTQFFGGVIAWISEVKKHTALPVLRKDFIIDEMQIHESYAAGADAILLIASLLTSKQLTDFRRKSEQLGMECLVEVHTLPEVKKALVSGASIIGINNRNLSTFVIDRNTTTRLSEKIPSSVILVSESGFQRYDDIQNANTNAVLIGTHFMRSGSLLETMRSMRRTKVKICGITSLKDALAAVDAGADFLGFNFYAKSPRYIAPEHAAAIIAELPNSITPVGVFVNEKKEVVEQIATQTGISMIQLHGDETDITSSLPVIKSYGVDGKIPAVAGIDVFGSLFDAYDPVLYGGTGKKMDPTILTSFPKKMFVAGGLHAGNVAEVVRLLDPFGVDVCSGVESKNGVKDARKMQEFIRQVSA